MIGVNFKDVSDNSIRRLSDSPIGKLLENFSESLTGKYDSSLAKGIDKEISSVKSLKECVKDSAPLEVIKTVTYFSFLHMTTAIDYSASILEHYSGFNVEESYYGEIRDLYNDLITPEYLKVFYKEQSINPEQLIHGMTEITCNAVDAVAYLGSKMLLGVAGVVEDASTFAIGTIADVSGHPEVAEKLYKSDIVRDVSNALDKSYNGTELVKQIGTCVETFGEAGTYIALSVLGASGAPIIAFASAAGIGVARAGEVTRESVEKTGQYTHKELLSGIISGVISVASSKLIPIVNESINKFASPAMEKITEKVGSEAARHIVSLGLGSTEAAFIGGVDAAVFEFQDVLKDFVAEALEIDDNFEVDWNHFIKGIATGAAINGSVYLVSNVARDIHQNKNENRDSNLKEANEKKQAETAADGNVVEKDIEKLTKEYLEDLNEYSECADTIPNNPFNAEDLKKRMPEETKELRKEFNVEKEKLIAEWEKVNGREWPVYEKDIYNEYGEIVKKKGWKYDAHHIQPLSMGGRNEASNITPLRYDIHNDHKGVHAPDSPYDKLEKMLKETVTNE